MEKLIPYKDNLCSKYAEKMISIKLTSRCNAKCSFCVDRGGYTPDKDIKIRKIAEEANKLTEYQTVIITGGEPFLVFEDLVLLLELLRPYKKRIVVNTNGSKLDVKKTMRLNGLIDELQISIHNPDEEINNSVFGFKFNEDDPTTTYVHFELIKHALKYKKFYCSINTCFNKTMEFEDLRKMEKLVYWLGADKLRLTELKKVDDSEFVEAKDFFRSTDEFCNRTSEELITNGCMKEYITEEGIFVSVKRLCKYAKGTNAPAFSCCFINTNGQTKINVDTKDTFKVIYADGSVYDDWIFNGIKK